MGALKQPLLTSDSSSTAHQLHSDTSLLSSDTSRIELGGMDKMRQECEMVELTGVHHSQAMSTGGFGGAAAADYTSTGGFPGPVPAVSTRPPPAPAEVAEFDGDTGAPVNKTAKREMGREWATRAAADGGKPRVVQLQFSLLDGATDGFDELNEIGGGASCAVYRGQVFGALVAIKRLKEGSAEWEVKQFASEMALLIRVSHRSICRLFAFSTDGPQRCLVLELCTGGALDTRLSCRATGSQQPPAPLGWQQRVHIAFGVASALSYLHALTPQMIHRYASTNLRLLLSLALLARLRKHFL
jgi:serine/threonine protein kinase